MPSVKRHVKPHQACHAAVPERVGSELECVTNNTLSSIIHQLSTLSQRAEDAFGELFSDANTFYTRTNSLQGQLQRLAAKVTQLDSAPPQDVNAWKVFGGSIGAHQQVACQCSLPDPALSMPPAFREEAAGIKFCTDPSYFFDLWKEKMVCGDEGTLPREVDTVCKAQTRPERNMTALLARAHPRGVQQRAPSDSAISPETSRTTGFQNIPDHAHFRSDHALAPCSKVAEHQYQSIGGPVGVAGYGLSLSSGGGVSGEPPPVDCGPLSPPPAPVATPATQLAPPTHYHSNSSASCPLPSVPLPGPPPGPPPPPVLPALLYLKGSGKGRSQVSQPITDGRSDLLSAIRMGIQLKKVQEQQALRECTDDVASILSRRIAVEYSDSEDESEQGANEWSD